MPLSPTEYGWLGEELHCYANRITPDMSAFELREALRGVTGSEELTIEQAPNGNQVIHLGDKTLEVGPMASNDEIIAALQNPFIRTENTHMSITGASFLADSIKAKIQAAKDRVAASASNTTAALAKLNSAADHADSVSQAIEAEADALTKELGQFSNGGPA